MAITNAQQYQQLVNPPMKGKKRPGYRGDDAYGGRGDKSGNPGGGKGDGPSARDRNMGLQGKTGKTDKSLDGGGVDRSKVGQFSTYGKNLMVKNLTPPSVLSKIGGGIKNFITSGGLIGAGIRGLASVFGPKDLGIRDGYNMANIAGPTSTDDDDDDRGGGDGGIPYWAQLGYPSQAAYLASLQAPAGLPAAVQPQQTMDLNRIAYRLMADGGFLGEGGYLGEEDEPRQAYGLGSFVKKVVKKATTLPRKVLKTVKKVAKSPLGRLALAVAAPYALGPAMAQSQFLMGLSSASRAALISGATTGITQLASGEDLDLKDIALSAAIGGGSAKFFPPGGAPKGIDPSSAAGRARVASDIGAGAIPDRAMGQIASRAPTFTGAAEYGMTTRQAAATPSIFTRPTMADVGVTGMPSVKQSGLEKLIASSRRGLSKVKDSKLTDILLRDKDGGIDPLKSIFLATTLSGLAAKKDFEEDEFSDVDRGEKLDIAAIRRRPFEYMAPRFAGSRFDFYDTAAANGGRIGYQEAGAVLSEKEIKKLSKSPLYKGFKKMYSVDPQMAKDNPAYKGKFDMFKKVYDQKFQKGGKAEPVAKKVMPLLDMGGQEMDLRAEGGFVPIGRMEKADDVPARLSKNEFVFTAEAVRNAGEGDVDKGAEVMYNMMKNLESGGDVSEESQGLKGARQMFQTSKRLEEVL